MMAEDVDVGDINDKPSSDAEKPVSEPEATKEAVEASGEVEKEADVVQTVFGGVFRRGLFQGDFSPKIPPRDHLHSMWALLSTPGSKEVFEIFRPSTPTCHAFGVFGTVRVSLGECKRDI